VSESSLPGPELVQRARRSLTRLTRFANRLQRMQLSCGPVTVQQCHTLEALMDGPRTMGELSDEVALHQSTLTRVVEKLRDKQLVVRRRRPSNQRVVEVELTTGGRLMYASLDEASNQLIGRVMALVDPEDREAAVRGLEIVTELLDPKNEAAQALMAGDLCGGDLPPA
jgi:DNA-binding MarR family transcriptional regulator